MDADEAGPSGRGGRPPPNEDGTPSETLADQVVRLTNLMSVLETLYSGDEILLVFPDGTGPALLSCLIGGMPLYRVHELNFLPGEIRQNVGYRSVNAVASVMPSPYYSEALQRGRKELRQLRENPDIERNVKDLKFEDERVVAEAQKKERQELEERQAKQNEFERRQKLEVEQRIKEEKRKERQIQTQKKEMERRKIKESAEKDAVLSRWGVVAGGIGMGLAATSLGRSNQNSTLAVIDTNVDKLDYGISLPNATIAEAESVDVDDVDVGDEADSRELDSKAMSEPVESAAAADTNAHEDQIESEDNYNDWEDWLGTINEIMNDDDQASPESS